MKRSLLYWGSLLLFTVSLHSAFSFAEGYALPQVDEVQSDALVSLYDKSTATVDSDSPGGAVDGCSIIQPEHDGTLNSEKYAAFTGSDTDGNTPNVEQIDYGWQRSQS